MDSQLKIEEFNRKIEAETEEHKAKLAELSQHCKAIVELMEYFDPPNLMAWTDDDPGSEWEVFIRRKGSDVEFGPDEWTKPGVADASGCTAGNVDRSDYRRRKVQTDSSTAAEVPDGL